MKKSVLIRIISVVLIMSLSVSVMVNAQDTVTENFAEKLDHVVSLLKQYHIDIEEDEDPIHHALMYMFENDPKSFDSFVNMMYQSYDKYSYYLKPTSYDKVFNTQKTMAGIGISIYQGEDGGCYIKHVIGGGPAHLAGLQIDDKIIAVGNKDVSEYSVSMIGDLLTDEVGTSANISVLRGEETLSFTVTRQTIPLSNVTFKNMGDNIAYFKISELTGFNTVIDFCTYYDILEENGFKSVILDLRDNPGGDLDCLINMMDNIIPDEGMPYLTVRQSNPMRLTTFDSEGYGWEFNGMIILVNENTASSAEVMAGALQDLGYAELVGVPTRGKGLGQNHIRLDDGSYAVISSHALLLPTTGAYNGIGIKPKHYAEMTTKTRTMPAYEKLNLERGVSQALSLNVLGVEQRLKAMGYFEDNPDKNPDFKTFHAINQFQKAAGIPQTDGKCDAATVRAIDDAFKAFIATPQVIDTQLDKAMALARVAAKSNKKPTPIEPEQARFTSDK